MSLRPSAWPDDLEVLVAKIDPQGKVTLQQ